jgi:hypothetical protein
MKHWRHVVAIGVLAGLCACQPASQEPVANPADQEIAGTPEESFLAAPPLYVAGQILAKPKAGVEGAPALRVRANLARTELPNGAQLYSMTAAPMRSVAQAMPYLADFSGLPPTAISGEDAAYQEKQAVLADAMDAEIKRMEASGQYEWVSRNWVLQAAFERLPKPAPGKKTGPAAANRPNDPLYPRQWAFLPN